MREAILRLYFSWGEKNFLVFTFSFCQDFMLGIEKSRTISFYVD